MGKRNKAIFQGSRLYRQAEEGSSRLLDALRADEPIYKNEINALSSSGMITFSSRGEADYWVSAAVKAADSICKQISPYIAVPTLLQAVVEQYYGFMKGESSPLGRYLKRTLEVIGGNIYKSQLVQSDSQKKVTLAVRATALAAQLQTLAFLYEEFATGSDYLELTASGLKASESLGAIVREYIKPVPPPLKFMRTLSNTERALWQNLPEGMKAVEEVIRGDSPQNQSIFQGTIFKELIDDIPAEFWAGIWARMKLAAYSYAIRKQVNENFRGISIFEPFRVSVPADLDVDLLQGALHQLFWEDKWYGRSLNEQPGNLISERPAICIRRNPTLYTTNTLLVGDSLNWFIEASVVPYPEAQVVRLPDTIFKRLVSEPFEISVNDLFRQYGFLAGNVSDRGGWATQEGQILLTHERGEGSPGEIDSLAYHRECDLVILAECKVISGPFQASRMRNIARKLGNSDAEEFHSKLRQKLAWLQKTDFFIHAPRATFSGLIVLDVSIRWIPPGEFKVIDIDQLGILLAEIKENC